MRDESFGAVTRLQLGHHVQKFCAQQAAYFLVVLAYELRVLLLAEQIRNDVVCAALRAVEVCALQPVQVFGQKCDVAYIVVENDNHRLGNEFTSLKADLTKKSEHGLAQRFISVVSPCD